MVQLTRVRYFEETDSNRNFVRQVTVLAPFLPLFH